MIEAAVLCMALNLYHEGAKNESIDGLFAIAQVTLNRAKRDPEKVCDVVFAPHQFAWTQKPPAIDKASIAWRNAQSVAKLAFYQKDFTGGADHYHAFYVAPYWKRDTRLEVAGLWGNHAFYRPRGKK